MPLLDHFHPPLDTYRHWGAFHGRWAGAIADALNGELLPAGYFAEMHVHVGSVQVDVGTFERDVPSRPASPGGDANGSEGGTATLVAPAWAPPMPDLSIPAPIPDEIEVLVRDPRSAGELVAAIELVSPRNKDRPESRRAFAAKCDAYLQRRVGLIIVDVVTERRANLHDELMRLRGHEESTLFPGTSPIYTAAYRHAGLQSDARIDAWLFPLEVGAPLPTLPLALRDDACLPIDLEATYMEVRRRSRLD